MMINPYVKNASRGLELDGWGSCQIDRPVPRVTLVQILIGYGKEEPRELCVPRESVDTFYVEHKEELNHGYQNIVLVEGVGGICIVRFFCIDDFPPTVYEEKFEPDVSGLWVPGYRSQIIVPEQ